MEIKYIEITFECLLYCTITINNIVVIYTYKYFFV
jgi:hypothetical protein